MNIFNSRICNSLSYMMKFTSLLWIALLFILNSREIDGQNAPAGPLPSMPPAQKIIDDAKLLYTQAKIYADGINAATQKFSKTIENKLNAVAGKKTNINNVIVFVNRQSDILIKDVQRVTDGYTKAVFNQSSQDVKKPKK